MAAETNIDRITNRLQQTIPLDQFPQDGDEKLRALIADAAEEINQRRGTTTVLKRDTISLSPDTDVYALPDDCVKVVDLIPHSGEFDPAVQSFQDFPPQFLPAMYYGGMLPTGQQATGSIDLIRRIAAERTSREVTWRQVGTDLELQMQISEATDAELVYRAVDRSAENVPERFWSKIELFVRAELLDLSIERTAGIGDQTASTLLSKNLGVLMELGRNHRRRWSDFLSSITPEQGTDGALME